MKARSTTRWGSLLLGAGLALFAGCSGDDDDSSPGGSRGDGTAECQVLGELCHEADSGSGSAHACHDVGHRGDGAECVKQFSGCVDVCVTEDGAGSDQDSRCAALGELCHPVDDGDGPLHECHELGHVNDADRCASAFQACAARCLAAREAAESVEDPGAGGAPSEHEH